MVIFAVKISLFFTKIGMFRKILLNPFMKKMILLVVSIVLWTQSSLFAQKTVLIKDASLIYDATFVQIDTIHSKLELYLKGSKQLFQSFDSLDCPFQSVKKMILFKDFNLDGQTDFAVVNYFRDSSDSQYHIDVHFYDTVRRQFFRNTRGYFHMYSGPYDFPKYDLITFVDYSDVDVQILLYFKGSEKIFQKINSIAGSNINSFMCGFEDYDFDGQPELCHLGDQGRREAYYAIYRYHPKTNQFVLNQEMIDMLDGSRGYNIDKAQKRIGVLFTPSGMEQETKEYQWIKGKGFILIETINYYHGSGGIITETKRQLIKGKWQTTTTKRKEETD